MRGLFRQGLGLVCMQGYKQRANLLLDKLK